MKSILTTISLLLFALTLTGQKNLVQNPGFEEGNFQGPATFTAGHHGYLADGWHSPTKRSPTLFVRPKRSVAFAKSGQVAMGILVGSGKQEKTKFEYLTGKLSEPLKKGQVYCIGFNTILQRTSRWAGTNFGILLHHDRDMISHVADPTTLSASLYAEGGGPVTPTGWRQYNGYYVASGGEQYITFGKFGKDDAVKMTDLDKQPYYELDGYQGKAMYQLDEISVSAIGDSVDCGCAEDIPDPTDSTYKKKTIPPFLFALDVSSSMRKNDLFDRLRNSLRELLSVLPEGSPVSFVSFSSGARSIFSGNIDGTTPGYIDSALVKRGLSGGTNVFAGLNLSYSSFNVSSPDSARMILISDGSFTVTKKIEELVKKEYETNGRKLTVVQIEARANGAEKLLPYEASFINTTPSEINQTISALYRNQGKGEKALACECTEEYSDTLNYHFVIDYSGSMRQEKGRAVKAVQYLFERAPDNAMISITAFNTQAHQMYAGPKSGITMQELNAKLRRFQTGGGTNPEPGVRNGVRLAYDMRADRYSHLIIVTDYTADQLTKLRSMCDNLSSNMLKFDLSTGAIRINSSGVMSYTQFDASMKEFLAVNKQKFEEDLFNMVRSSCNYTSQPYHYNPAKTYMKQQGKALLKNVLGGVMGAGLSN